MSKDKITAKINAVRSYWKTLLVLEGVEVVVLSLLIILIGGFYIDMIFKLNYLGRYLLSGGSLLIILTLLVLYVIIPAAKKIDDDTIALALEEKNPTLKSMLISAIQLKRTNEPEYMKGSASMIEALQLETIKHVREIHYSKVYKRLRLVVLAVFFVGMGAAAVKYSTSYPEAVRTWFMRVVTPGKDIAPFSFTKIEVEPKNKAILKGEDVVIKAVLTGEMKETCILHIKPVGGEWEKIAMKKSAEGKFDFAFTGVVNSFKYYITSGDGKSNEYNLLAKERPAVIKTVLRYVYPDYTGIENKTDDMPGGDITALSGTKVQFECLTNTEIGKGTLEFADGSQLSMKIKDDTRLFSTLVIDKDTALKIKLVSREGFTNLNPPEFTMRALPDNPPVCDISEPALDISVTRIATVPVSFRAADDFGVANVFFKYKISGSEAVTSIPMKIKQGSKVVSDIYKFELRNLPLDAGKKVEFYISAIDNHPLPPQEGDSLHRVLSIIDKAEVMVQIRQEEQKIKEELQAVIDTELSSKAKVDTAKEAKNQGDKEKEKLEEAAVEQKEAMTKTGQIAETMQELIEKRKSNELANTAELKNREAMKKALDALAQEEMRKASDNIAGAALENNQAKAKADLNNASKDQADIVRQLEKLRDSLGKIDIIEELIADAQKLLVNRKELALATKTFAKRAIGLKESDLGDSERAAVTELSNGEKALKTKVGLLASKTWTAQKDLAKTDAEISKGLSIVERQFMPLELKIEKLSGYLVNMKLSVSFDEQEKTEGMIKKIINDLEKLRRKNATEAGETDQNAKALNELQNAMDSARQAADQQLDINNATKKQGGLNVPEPETMKDLSKKQSDVKNQMEDTAKQLKNNSRTYDQGKQMDDTIRNMENSRSR